jgi:hypothetical protein
MVFGLPHHRVIAIDTEYIARPGERQQPVCLGAMDIATGQEWQLWLWHAPAPEPPFPIDKYTLFVAYEAFAEFGTFLEVGWPLPPHMVDLFAEFVRTTNGIPLAAGRGLLGACSYYGIPAITKEAKRGQPGLDPAR